MTFRRFMELALYCPDFGYYEGVPDNIGTRGDFYTSVSVGSLFGELLGWQFAEWMVQSPPFQTPSSAPEGGPWRIVEAGAHEGRLAADILRWLRERRTGLFERLEYWLVEPSERRREWQRQALGEFGAKVRWVRTLAELGAVRGVIFSNELLDAMPVSRWGWDAQARQWFEWGVTVREGRFEWMRMEPPVQSPMSKVPSQETQSGIGSGAGWGPSLPAGLSAVLPDGFTVETHEAAAAWWREAAATLEQGRVMTVDYGLTEEELFVPERSEGTVRAYRQHRVSRDVLADPGEQDITAHVNFTEILRAGEAAGLKTEVLTTQERFLTGMAAQVSKEPARFGDWKEGATRQFRTLTHPEHLGRAFRVLVQGK